MLNALPERGNEGREHVGENEGQKVGERWGVGVVGGGGGGAAAAAAAAAAAV